jgi:hypothetical protein
MIATRRIRPRSPDPIPFDTLIRGAVVLRGERAGIVAASAGERVLLWPVCWRNAERAADIPVTDWADRLLLGTPKAAMVQAAVLLDVPLAGQRRLGQIGAALLARIEFAAARDSETGGVIRRWHEDRVHRDARRPPPVVF